MKNLYLLVLLSLFVLEAARGQSELKENQFRERIWSGKNEAFTVREVPDKWKEESVVWLAKKVDYEIEKRSFLLVLDEQIRVHNRIKVMDNDGVKAFSELEFEVPRSDYADMWNGSFDSEFFFGAKIIKPDGKENVLNKADLVHVEVKVNTNKYEKYKIAIPELEQGDIIDYYFGLNIPRSVETAFESPSYDFLLSGKYPTLYQEYNIILNKKCYLNADSYNGAPEFELVDRERKMLHYRLVDIEREKYESERWTYDLQVMPFIKFKAFYYRREKYVGAGSFPNMSAKIDKPIAKWELLNFVNELTSSTSLAWKITARLLLQTAPYEAQDVRDAQRYLRKHYKKEMDPLKKAEAAYYYLRHANLSERYEYNLFYDKKTGFRVNDRYFTKIFSRILERNKIEHDIIVCVPKPTGLTIKNAIHSDDLRYLIAVKGKNKEKVYFDRSTYYTNPGELESWIEGVPAYAIKMVKKKRRRKVEEIQLPVSSYAENKEDNFTKVSMLFESSPQLKLERNITVAGHQKEEMQLALAVGYNYIDHLGQRGLELLNVPRYAKMGRKDRKSFPQKKQDLREEKEKDIRDEYLKSIQSSLSTEKVELLEVKLEEPGIWSESADFVYSDKLLITDFIQQAGPNYLLELGKLIGGQVALKEREKERVFDMGLDYARSFAHTIEFELPEGYSATGLDKFIYSVDNTAGSFISKAEQQGNKIIITSEKVYKTAQLAKESWPEMVSFLDAAYEFSQQKLLLKKVLYGKK